MTSRHCLKRRRSNPDAQFRQYLGEKQLTKSAFTLSGDCQERCFTECQSQPSVDADLAFRVASRASLDGICEQEFARQLKSDGPMRTSSITTHPHLAWQPVSQSVVLFESL